MVTETEFAACCRHVARRQIACSSDNEQRTVRRVAAEAILVKHTLEVLESGRSRGIILKVLRRSRKDCGFSLQTWLMVINIVVRVIAWVVEWWDSREKSAEHTASHTPPHVVN